MNTVSAGSAGNAVIGGRPPLPVAIVGCGLIGAKRAEALAGVGELVAVHDIDSRRAEALAAEQRGAAAVCATAKEAFERAAGGLAIVATIHRALAPLAAAAAAAGCHVLVEKPAGRNVQELHELAEVAALNGRVVRVGFNHRFHPAVLEAYTAVAGGRYGAPFLVRARYGHGGRIGYEREWRADRELSGGGELLDQGVHLIDLARFFLGPLTLRHAALATSYWATDVEDNAFVHLESDAGANAWLHASWTEWKNLFSFEVACRTAKVEITGLGGSYGPERLTVYEMGEQLGPPKITTLEWPPGDDSWRLELADVVGAIDGRAAVGSGLDDATATLSIVEEAYDR